MILKKLKYFLYVILGILFVLAVLQWFDKKYCTEWVFGGGNIGVSFGQQRDTMICNLTSRLSLNYAGGTFISLMAIVILILTIYKLIYTFRKQ